MKPKVLNKKLKLSRETISNLSNGNMKKLRGGDLPTRGCVGWTEIPRCFSDEPGCTVLYTCDAGCTYAYSKNGKVC